MKIYIPFISGISPGEQSPVGRESFAVYSDHTTQLHRDFYKPWNKDPYEPISISWFMSAKGFEGVAQVGFFLVSISNKSRVLRQQWCTCQTLRVCIYIYIYIYACRCNVPSNLLILFSSINLSALIMGWSTFVEDESTQRMIYSTKFITCNHKLPIHAPKNPRFFLGKKAD